MKRIFLLLICVIGAITVVSAQSTKKNEKETVTFLVTNMDCENCVKKVEKNIAFEKGVTDLKCDLKTKTVKVTFQPEKTTEKKLLDAFKKIKMDAEVKKDEK